MTPDSPVLIRHLDGARLVYKGDGDYDVIAGPVTIELAYDGSDYSVGRWDFWNLNIAGQRVGGTGIVGPGPFHDWLEANARGEGGRLPDEPERPGR